jgi:hypothetical protein
MSFYCQRQFNNLTSTTKASYNISMTNLFRKAIIFTDIHFGLKSNSQLHNEDCLNFVKWASELGRAQGCETALFLGDWHNNRASINVLTLNYSLQALELLDKNFQQVFFIPGNHDQFFKDKRDVTSVAWAKHLPNVHIINDWFNESGVTIAPWLVGEEHKKVHTFQSQYMFGHFELPHFYMNSLVAMPEHGEIRREHFGSYGHVFTGHFHKRQTHRNITYIGNCFPHNYADAGDNERGAMILEWGSEPQFYSWPDQPTYNVFNLSALVADPGAHLKRLQHVRVRVDVDLSYEEANYLKETFAETYQLREIAMIPQRSSDLDSTQAADCAAYQSVDQIVTTNINAIDSDHFDRALLLDIYRNL